MKRILVWDLPLRVFHWALVVCVAGAFVSVNIGGNAMIWHGRFGLAVAALLTFRLCWGILGSTHARFASFVRGPGTVLRYLRGEWSGEGHNPLGALSVLGMLTVLLALVATGVFGNDDIAFEGPLYAMVGKERSDQLISLHRLLEPIIIALVIAHLAAIAFYTRVKKHNLVAPMIRGWKEVEAGSDAQGGGAFALVVSLTLAAGVVYVASGALLPPPPPVPPAATSSPGW